MNEDQEVDKIESNSDTSGSSSEEQNEINDVAMDAINIGDIKSENTFDNYNGLIDSNNNKICEEEQIKKTENKCTNTEVCDNQIGVLDDVLVNFETFIEKAINSVEQTQSNVVQEKTDDLRNLVVENVKSNRTEKVNNTDDTNKNNHTEKSNNPKSTSKNNKKSIDKTKKQPLKITKVQPILPRRRSSRRRKTVVKSYNEDSLMKEHLKECLLKFYLEN